MSWSASAPSNIALIKYMGKTESSQNRPTNSSLSYTLDALQTYVVVEKKQGGEDAWEALREGYAGLMPIDLSATGREKFLLFFARMKARFDINQAFWIRSANNFPSDCGIASSASAFAALTRASASAFAELTKKELPAPELLSQWSREGSGSSCRSFFSPWSIWREAGGEAVPSLSGVRLIHQVVVVDSGTKQVSSSEAHRKVVSSLLFSGRKERAETRLLELLQILQSQSWTQSWQQAFQIVWSEFFDMHALFETANPPFGYFVADSIEVLNIVREEWRTHHDGPLVTMDAGPNVHLLWRPEQTASIQRLNGVLRSVPERQIFVGSHG